MKKTLSFVFVFIVFICFAQNEEIIYLQQEHDRLARVANHEIAIQNYINQNIASYNLPSAVINKISTTPNEDGNLLTGVELNAAILSNKKQNLREQYFNQNSSIANDYIATPLTLATACANNGFENNDASGFNFFSQRFMNYSWKIFENFPTQPTIVQPNGKATVVNNSNMDEIIPTLSRVYSGNYALRLNNSKPDYFDGDFYFVSSLKREFIATQNNINFKYALVLQDPDHVFNGNNQNPYYQCTLKTSNGDIIVRKIVADKNNTAVFKTMQYLNQDLVYTDWLCESIDVSQYMGQTVMLEIIIADCGQGAHFGYAYFDDFCGTRCSAPTFGKVTLDPMGITCPLLPLTVSGSFITPAGYVLDGLTLQAKEYNTETVVYTSSTINSLFGNEFSFKVAGSDLFPSGVSSNKQLDFFVTAKFKLIGATTYMDIPSQSANDGADVIFFSTCKICNSCAPPTGSFRYIGRWGAGDTLHNPEVNSWVDYINESGNTIRKIIGPIENGCQEIIAVRILQINGVNSCDL